MQSEALIKNLIYFVSISSNLGVGLFVFLKGRREKINRNYFLAIIFASVWLISLFLFYAVESQKWVLWLGRINFAVVLPMFYYLVEFVFVFPREIFVVPRKFKIGLRFWIILFTALTLFTPLVGKREIIIAPGQRETVYGALYPLYALHYIVFSVIIITLLFHKFKKIKDEIEKNQLRYILVGLSLALLFGFITNILLYSWGMYEMANFGPLATVIFSGFVTIAILKHYLFDIKVIAVELFTVLLLFVLLISIFVAQTPTQRILNITIFLGSAVFGVFLIKSVIQEIEMRQKVQKMARELQKAYKELKKLDEAKSEFIAMASHQLRTPLSIIKGLVSMTLEGSYNHVSGKVKKSLTSVFNSNERLVRIVNDLLSISKIELGKLEKEEKPVQIEQLIESVFLEMESKAKAKGLKFLRQKPRYPLPTIKADELKIRQVILNLVDNAIRYTQKGEIEIRAEKKGSKLVFSVKDTGEGMDAKEQEKLFEAFVRGAAGTALWIQGAGLGLYLAKKYLELHHGRIWAESPGKGKGSTFYVELPIT